MDEDFTEEEGAQIQQELEKPKEEEKKPLTAEEKAEKLAKLEELRVKKRAEREAREKEEAKAKEKARIESGKDMGEIRQALAEQEIKKLAAIRRQEKEDDKKAKARVLAQIEADKAARKAEREAAQGKKTEPAAAPAPAPAAAPAPKKDYTETRVQVVDVVNFGVTWLLFGDRNPTSYGTLQSKACLLYSDPPSIWSPSGAGFWCQRASVGGNSS